MATVNPGATLAKMCGRKKRYGSRASAEFGMRGQRDEKFVHAYRCPVCTFWHTGHFQRPTRARGRRSK